MDKVKVEFINTCPCCDEHENFLRETQKRFSDSMDLSIYHAGKDFCYLAKYGQILRGTLIINESEMYEDLSRKRLESVLTKALGIAL